MSDGSSWVGRRTTSPTAASWTSRPGWARATSRPAGSAASRRSTPLQEEFGQLVADCDDYQLIPLLVAAPGTSVTTTTQALEIVRVLGGAVVLTVSTSQSAFEIEAQVLEAGNHLGYLRLLAEELDAVTEDDARRTAGDRSGACADRGRFAAATPPSPIRRWPTWRPGRTAGAS